MSNEQDAMDIILQQEGALVELHCKLIKTEKMLDAIIRNEIYLKRELRRISEWRGAPRELKELALNAYKRDWKDEELCL